MAGPKLSFPKVRRLRRAAEFERVRREGVLYRGKGLSLGVLMAGTRRSADCTRRHDAPPLFQVGFIVSRRIGDAVVRNRIRRRLREIVRHHQRELGAGVWLVVIARSAAASATYQQLEDEWLRLAKRASILAA